MQFNGTTGILKCSSQEKENTILLLQSLKNIDGKPVTITTRSTSGTIHGLKEKQ
jgi:RNase P/RNase MRP subunit POP5